MTKNRHTRCSRVILCLLALALTAALSAQSAMAVSNRSIREFGVTPDNDADTNARNLQAAIDWATTSGAALFVEPSAVPYPVSSGIILKKNVSLVGVNAPTPRGTRNAAGDAPVGSVFAIRDSRRPFITVESATQLRGIQFYYPDQELHDPALIKPYPPTIQASQTTHAQGVTLSSLTFYGEYVSMDFQCKPEFPCELILIEHCYGYPLSGQFIRLDYCYDIPRFLHCHVNPAIMREMGRHYSRAVIDSVIQRKSFAYTIDHTDNAQLIDLFTFATWGGIYLGDETYGQLTNFNFDCVTVGIMKKGSQNKNRNWQIAQGSIIANAGTIVDDIHPIIIEGRGHTSLANVESFSGGNPALTNSGKSKDFMLLRGKDKCTVTLTGCRMRNYITSQPITMENPNAKVQAAACVDNSENFYNVTLP